MIGPRRPRALVLGLLCGVSVLVPYRGEAQWLDLRVPPRPPGTTEMVERGREIYQERCWFCHGEEGDGLGPVAEYLWPRPRDFTAGSFKLRTTTSGELPTDEDLFRTVTLGIPGTAMPEWRSVLSADQRWQVISYLKTFAADLFEDERFDPYKAVMELGPQPRGAAVIEEGRAVYDSADCWECHGALGRGDGEKADELTDDWGFPIWPSDLHLGWRFKGGSTVRDIYLRFTTGLDGTPMPSYSKTLSDEERWQLARYIASLRGRPGSERSTGAVITARRIEGELPASPDDPAWDAAPEVSVPLTGQATFAPRWQIPAVSDLAVRVMYNAEAIVLRLSWDDRFADTLSADSALERSEGWDANDTYPVLFRDGGRVRGSYPDGLEVMFPVRFGETPALPHFVYGNAGQPVDLWRWRADLQHAPGNPGATLELRAAGVQQPPEAHPPESQRVTGEGVWRDGRWTLVLRRPLATEDGAREVQLRPGEHVPVAFHVWEGANGETGLRMALSSWYYLYLKEPVRVAHYLVVVLVVVGGVALEYGAVRWTGRRAERGLLLRYRVQPTISDPGALG